MCAELGFVVEEKSFDFGALLDPLLIEIYIYMNINIYI